MCLKYFDDIEMTRFFTIVFCITLFVACKPGIPKDIVQPNEMEKILFDIHVIDGYVSLIPTPDSAKKVTAPMYKGIYKKYGIDSALHAKSMAYYYKHPDLLSKMYDRISEKMAKTRDTETKNEQKALKLEADKEAKLQKAAEAKKADSIKKAAKVNKIDTAKNELKPMKRLVRKQNATK
jgi:hypothetical protein